MKRLPDDAQGRARRALTDFAAHERHETLARATADGIELAAYPYPGGFNHYPIEWRRLDSPDRLLRWILHLTDKAWFTPDMCRDLIEATAARFGWDMDLPQ